MCASSTNMALLVGCVVLFVLLSLSAVPNVENCRTTIVVYFRRLIPVKVEPLPQMLNNQSSSLDSVIANATDFDDDFPLANDRPTENPLVISNKNVDDGRNDSSLFDIINGSSSNYPPNSSPIRSENIIFAKLSGNPTVPPDPKSTNQVPSDQVEVVSHQRVVETRSRAPDNDQ